MPGLGFRKLIEQWDCMPALPLRKRSNYLPFPPMPFKVIRSPAAASKYSREACGPVVLVPTMGALHAGHAKLIRRARSLAGSRGTVVVSTFVNPTQFGPNEDFSRYPRTPAADRKLCVECGANLIFAPHAPAMYAENDSTFVEETRLSAGLCGASRPGHFRGVCTVVAKLFLIVSPQIAVFGRKDYQQLAVIRRMVRDLHFPVKIAAVDTVRETDGLAISSRNEYLSPLQRSQAPVIIQALRRAKASASKGNRNASELEAQIRQDIQKTPEARIDYVAIVDTESLEPVQTLADKAVVAVAVYFGKTRLIDNITLSCPH
jgi:pantoate--beta-alanine ligase